MWKDVDNPCFLFIVDVNPWTDSDTIVNKTVSLGNALVLEVPPIDAIPQPEQTSLEWYRGDAPPGSNDLPTLLVASIDYHISLSLQLIIFNVANWYNGNMYQAQYSNFYTETQHTIRSRRFRLIVSKYAQKRDSIKYVLLKSLGYNCFIFTIWSTTVVLCLCLVIFIGLKMVCYFWKK